MSDKILDNVAAVLGGKRMKFLDPSRKAVLALPDAAFKVWMAYWMHESDGQEAYPEMDTLVLETGVSESTIRRARNYLVRTGWLLRLEGSAGSRYTKASNGSWNIGVYRVNDPTSVKMSDAAVKLTEPEGESVNSTGYVNLALVTNLTPNIASAFAVASTGTTTVSSPVTDTLATPHTSEKVHPSLRESKPEEQKQKPCVPVQAGFNCPVCEFTHKAGYRVVEHIEKQHPEHAPVSFEIVCPACDWFRTRWNTIQNNKADKEAELADHLDTDHTPDSPRYDPWEPCPVCEINLQRSSMTSHQSVCKGKRP